MNVITLIILFVVLVSVKSVQADIQAPLSLKEMEERSSLVVDGTVTEIVMTEVKETPHPNGIPVMRSKFKAVFKVNKIIKGEKKNKSEEKLFVNLEYWKVSDDRFRGDKVPDINVGDKFRLYAEAVSTSSSGEITAYIHTSNAVRPEALELEGNTIAPP